MMDGIAERFLCNPEQTKRDRRRQIGPTLVKLRRKIWQVWPALAPETGHVPFERACEAQVVEPNRAKLADQRAQLPGDSLDLTAYLLQRDRVGDRLGLGSPALRERALSLIDQPPDMQQLLHRVVVQFAREPYSLGILACC